MPSRLKASHHLRSNGNIRAGASAGTKHTIGLGLGFKYISTILKGSEQAPNFVEGLGLGLFKQRRTKTYLTRNLKSSSEVRDRHVVFDSYAILFESKTSSAFEWEHQSWRQRWD